MNIFIIQGSIQSIKTIYTDKNSFGIGELIKNIDKFPMKSQIQMKNLYHTGETSNYDFIRTFLIVEGRDLSKHFYMLVYQVDKQNNEVKSKILWGEQELIYLKSKYLMIDDVFYDPDTKIVVKQSNSDFEEKTLFANYLKKELVVFDKIVQNYKK